MKKNVLFLLMFLSAFSVFSFSKNNYQTKKGFIKSMGPEPFTEILFVTDDGFEYLIAAEASEKDKIKAGQGKRLQFTGIIEKKNSETRAFNKGKDGIFTVYEWKIIK